MTILQRIFRIGAPALLALLTLMLCGGSMPAFADNSLPDAGITTRLPNGLTVLIRPDSRFPLVSLRLYVRTGSAYESDAEAGISHVLEHMVFKGTEQRPSGAVAEDIEQAGGYLNAATSFDYTVYITDMPAAEWKMGMDVLKDMAFSPALDPDELASEQQVVVAELQRGKDSPSNRLFQAIQASALAGTTYSRPIIGYEETINSFTSEMIRDYISRHYQPQSMYLVVVGDVDQNEALAEARRLFGDLQNSGDVPVQRPLSPADLPVQPTVLLEEGPWNKTYLTLALPVPGFADADSPTLDVLAQLLGGDRTSLLYQTYKYQLGLVDEIYAANYSFERIGLFIIGANLDTDKVPEFLDLLGASLSGLKADQFSPEEYARARLNLEDDMQRAKETLPGLASKIGYFEVFGQNEDNYLRQLATTGPEQVQAAISRWIKPDQRVLALLAPEGSGLTEQQLTARIDTAWPQQNTAATTASARQVAEPETVILGPGRTVILLPDHTLPYTAADLSFSGGSFLLAPEQQGLAAFTAEALTSGTQNATAPELEAFKADRAAGLSASAGRQVFTLSVRQPSRFDADMFGLLTETISSPAFDADEIDREKTYQLAAITSAEDQPLSLIFRYLTQWLFPNHPYGYLQLGQPEQVQAFTRDDVLSYWAKQVQQPWVLAVCGDFDREEVLRLAGSLPVPSSSLPNPGAPVFTTQREHNMTLAGRNQAHLMLVFPTVGKRHEDSPGLDLLAEILAGQSGLLFRDLRDVHGLAYTVTAWNWQATEAGFMAFYIGTEPDKLEASEQGFARIIADLLANPLPEDELLRGKNQMTGNYYRDHQRLGSRSNEAATLTALGFDKDYGREIIERANLLTPADLQALARKYLVPGQEMKLLLMP